MENKLNLSGKLDFSDIDLTAPNKVVEEIVAQLAHATNDIIHGAIVEYNGHITSYTKAGWSAISAALGTIDTKVDIQTTLGKSGEEEHKYELYLHTPLHKHYKFRVLYLQYGIANYPVKVVLEQNVANDVYDESNASYIVTCDNRDELEELIYSILNSKKIIRVMQELIRINQVQKELSTTTTNETESNTIETRDDATED